MATAMVLLEWAEWIINIQTDHKEKSRFGGTFYLYMSGLIRMYQCADADISVNDSNISVLSF